MSDEFTIDDLLRYEEEPPPRPRREASGMRWWARTLLVAGGLTAVVVFGLRLFGVGVSAVPVLAGFIALLTLHRVTGWVAPPPPPRAGAHGRYTADEWVDPDGLRSAVQRWDRKLHWVHGEPARYADVVHPLLTELADERLRQRHGCTRATDPPRARQLLGESLSAFLASPPTRTPSPRQTAAILAELETI